MDVNIAKRIGLPASSPTLCPKYQRTTHTKIVAFESKRTKQALPVFTSGILSKSPTSTLLNVPFVEESAPLLITKFKILKG